MTRQTIATTIKILISTEFDIAQACRADTHYRINPWVDAGLTSPSRQHIRLQASYGEQVKKVRWDQFAISLLLSIALVAVLVAESIQPSGPALASWHVIVAWPLALIVVGGLVGTRYATINGSRQSQIAFSIGTVFACSVVLIALPNGNLIWVPFAGAAIAAGARLDLWLRVLLLVVPLGTVIGITAYLGSDAVDVLINGAICVGVFVLVRIREQQREADELARTQSEIIARERLRAEAAARQRNVAADLHDVLAHTLSGLIVTLQGATLTAQQQNVSADLTERLATATTLARDGLREARHAVENLHPGIEPHRDDVVAWFAQTVTRLQRTARMTITVDGSITDIPSDWRDLARSVLMESLTNSMKHAAGAPVTITFHADTECDLEILSAGDVAEFHIDDSPGGGHGLAGLAARINDRGGLFSYGPQAAGFLVRLQIPPDGTV